KYSACIGTSTESAATSALRVKRSKAGGQSRTMKSNCSRMDSSAVRRRNSLFSAPTSSILAPIRFLCDGIRLKPSNSVVITAPQAGASAVSRCKVLGAQDRGQNLVHLWNWLGDRSQLAG